MKLLYICNKIDKLLDSRVDELRELDFEIDIVALSSATLHTIDSEKSVDIDHKNFQNIFKNLKYKRLFDILDKYDGVVVYKCIEIASSYFDTIKKLSKRYLVVVDKEFDKKSRNITKLLDGSSCILLQDEEALSIFEEQYGYDEKTLIDRKVSYLMLDIDSIRDSELERFQNFLELDLNKSLIYCDLGIDLELQKSFLDDILKLSVDKLRKSTFILDTSSSSIVDKELLFEYLTDKDFDYLLSDSLLSDRQKAMLILLSNSTIILSTKDPYNSLYPSLYVKNHIYRYIESSFNSSVDKIFVDHDIFIDSFENFENTLTYNSDSHHLFEEMLNKNQEEIKKLFHPKLCLKNYLNILEIL